MAKPSHEERVNRRKARDEEFVQAIEQIIGGKLQPWQKEKALYVRRTTVTNAPIDFGQLKRST